MSARATAMDRRLLSLTLLLVGLGVVMVYVSSSYRATLAGGTEFSVAARHTLRVGLGLLATMVLAFVPYRVSCRAGAYVFPATVGLLLLTVMGGGLVRSAHDIGRWLTFAGVVVQPVELAKLSLVLALPWWIDRHPEFTSRFRGGFVRLAAAPAVVMVLLVLQPNFGSALALGLLALLIFWLGGVPLRYLLPLVALGGLLCWLGYLHVEKLHDRVDTWLALLLEGRAASATAYQSAQALIGLGSGGLSGVGPGMSTMKYLFLPASHTDFIFAIVGEELGFAGAAGVVVVFGLWVARSLKIAWRAPDGLGYLTAAAVGGMVFCYAFLNLSVVMGLMPVTGLPLPFLSYGGSALVTNLAAVGVLLNISRGARRARRASDRWKGGR